MQSKSSICVLNLLIQIVLSYDDDLVSSIPYYTGNKVNFNTYSGYLDADSGRLFYVFTESSDDPTNNPLVLWLNGGPGCSSLIGQFIELGPYHPYNLEDTVNIEYNPYSWNNVANILFIESPPCVGFSYPYSMNCSSYQTNDNETKWNNYIALQSFFKKYTEYLQHEFIITGESYGGHYVPQLAELIVQQNKLISSAQSIYSKINLVAVGIGNPFINSDDNWFKGWIPTMYNYGIINDEIMEKLNTKQCANHTLDEKCQEYISSVMQRYPRIMININQYDVNVRANCSGRSRQETKLLRHIYESEDFVENLDEGNIWSYPYTPCNEINVGKYLNYDNVWQSFHVNQDWMNINDKSWMFCSESLRYDINGTDRAADQVTYIRKILSNDIRVLVYSGNTDLVCSFAETRYWIYNKLNKTYTGENKTNWTQWTVNDDIGGWYAEWDKLTFMVVRDAGHEVPEYQPIRAYSLFQRFISNNYQDIPVIVEHSEWNNYDENEQDQEDEKIKYIAIGIGIGVGISVFIILLIMLFKWIKKNYCQKTNDRQEPLLCEDL